MDTLAQAEFVERTNCINCGSQRFSELSRGRFSDLAPYMMADPGGDRVLPHFKTSEWVLVKCQDCGQVFHQRILNEEWNERRFSEWMSADAILEFEARHGPTAERKFNAAVGYVSHALRLERLTRMMRAGEPLRLLDFGCGWGGFLSVAKDFGFDAVGVDRSTPRIEGAAVQVFPSLGAMGERKPFHAVTLFEVLEHLDEPSTMLRELANYVMPGGILVLETPDCVGVTGIRSRHDYYKAHPLEHINCFTHETMISIAKRVGFELIVRGPAYVTSEYKRAVRRTIRHVLNYDQRSTQLYFRKA